MNKSLLGYLMMDEIPVSQPQARGKKRRSLRQIKIDDVRYFKKSGNYIYAYGLNVDGLLVEMARTALTVEAFKKKYWFLENLIRINQSVILNMNHVEVYQAEYLIIGNELFSVSKLGKEAVASFLAKHDPNY